VLFRSLSSETDVFPGDEHEDGGTVDVRATALVAAEGRRASEARR
jgi:hypothetical protein